MPGHGISNSPFLNGRVGGGATPDPDGLLFIAAEEAAGATFTAGQITAINNLFLDFKGQGPNNSTTDFWTTNKIKRYWPLVGASAAPNAIDVRLNTSSWFGGWTHSATGAKGNASNTYFETIPFQGESGGDWGHGMYVDDFTSGEWFSGYIRYAPARVSGYRTIGVLTGSMNVRGSGVTYAGDNYTGARSAIRISGDVDVLGNGAFVNTGASADDGDDAFPFFFGAINNSGFGPFGVNDMDYRSMYITYGITRAEAITLQNIDNAFQTALGRNIY
jgi:hypothetical protein